MKRYLTVLAIMFALTWGVTAAAQPADFGAILAHYEEIRQALLHDTADGVATRAGDIVDLVESAASKSEGSGVGVCSDTTDACDGIFGEVGDAALRLQTTKSLDESREVFGELSQALVRVRNRVDGPKPVVAYCSMVKKVWLQPKGEIGNPYFGQSMAGCGEVVSE